MTGSLPDEPGPDDRQLLRAHLDGDAEAFGILFARHRDRLWAVALRTTGDPDEAADALQDALIAAFRRADSYRGDAAVTTWLHRVVVNACLDRLRAAKVRRAESLPDDLDEHSGRGSVVTATGASHDPEQAAVADDRRRALLDALATLPPEQRAALVLVDMEGYPVAGLPSVTLGRGGRVAVITRGPTPFDRDAAVRMDGDVVADLEAVLAAL